MSSERKRCVLDMHDVRSIKDLVFVVGGNSESGAQKAIFEILDNHIRDGRSHHSSAGAEQAIRVLDELMKKNVSDLSIDEIVKLEELYQWAEKQKKLQHQREAQR